MDGNAAPGCTASARPVPARRFDPACGGAVAYQRRCRETRLDRHDGCFSSDIAGTVGRARGVQEPITMAICGMPRGDDHLRLIVDRCGRNAGNRPGTVKPGKISSCRREARAAARIDHVNAGRWHISFGVRYPGREDRLLFHRHRENRCRPLMVASLARNAFATPDTRRRRPRSARRNGRRRHRRP